jgi:hypothetical protein
MNNGGYMNVLEACSNWFFEYRMNPTEESLPSLHGVVKIAPLLESKYDYFANTQNL